MWTLMVLVIYIDDSVIANIDFQSLRDDVLFAKTVNGLISEVIELLDTHASNEQHQGRGVGVPPQD